MDNLPLGDSQINELFNVVVKTIMRQIHTLKDTLNAIINTIIPTYHAVIPWLVRRVAIMLNIYNVEHDDKTTYGITRGKMMSMLIVTFGRNSTLRTVNQQTCP